MSTLAKPEFREQLCRRLDRLDPNTKPKWGRMTAPQMICHLSDSFEVAVGERKVSMAASPIPRGWMKWFALSLPFRWPHGVPTRPEILQGRGGTPPGDWSKDRQRAREWIGNFAGRREFAPHPMFGPMSWDDWQVWGCRHVDHHLRQFGV